MGTHSAVDPRSRRPPSRGRDAGAEQDRIRHGREQVRASRRAATGEVDLNDLVAEIAASLHVAGPAHQPFATGELPRLRGGRPLLRRVLTDLMRNALEYACAEEPRVLISAARSGRAWEIRIDDNGDGLSAAGRERALETLHRGSGPRGNGAGRGLAPCRRNIESLGGTVDAVSGPLGGCRMRLTLPDESSAASRE